MIIVIVISIPFIGSYSVQSVDDLAYLVALGIDAGENNVLKVTFEFTMPNSSGENASSEVAPVIINSVEASSIDSAINLMNTYVSKEINLSHCKTIIFSEPLAQAGISKHIYSLMNKVQVRPDANIIVSKCSAKDFMKNVKPNLENLIAKYYEIAPVSSKYTGYTPNVTLGDFFIRLTSVTTQPIAMLGNISSKKNANNVDSSATTFTSEKDSEASAGSSSIENGSSSEIIGSAVFDKDVLVGELTAKETLCHLLIRNELENCNITISHPSNTNENIDLYLYNNSQPKIDVNIINGTPFIKVKLGLEARILSVHPDSEYDTDKKLSEISSSANQYIKSIVTDYLYKTSINFKADINGFGKSAFKLFLTQQEFKEYNWLKNYKNSIFDVSVDTNVKSSFLLSGD